MSPSVRWARPQHAPDLTSRGSPAALNAALAGGQACVKSALLLLDALCNRVFQLLTAGGEDQPAICDLAPLCARMNRTFSGFIGGTLAGQDQEDVNASGRRAGSGCREIGPYMHVR